MGVRNVPTVTRTVTISDMTPIEMASVFAAWANDDQAAFFDALRAEAKDWPGSGWCSQALAIIEKLNDDGLFVMEALAGHLAYRTEGKIV